MLQHGWYEGLRENNIMAGITIFSKLERMSWTSVLDKECKQFLSSKYFECYFTGIRLFHENSSQSDSHSCKMVTAFDFSNILVLFNKSIHLR